ncbi:MAG: peptidase M23 [Chitinophagaceae bacterium]|nr:MAG: peptidase M23 [Chitinophagaceae bacterium]
MTNPYLKVLLENQRSFRRVVPFDPATDLLRGIDLTATNTSLTGDLVNNTELFSRYIEQELLSSGARYLIGGYDEHRTIYSRSSLFDAETGDEPRRLHLGTDIWGPAGTPVSAPADAVVHSFADNSARGDYGATIILQHVLDEVILYSLYGHLSLASIEGLEEGKEIRAGGVFAWFGSPEENGQWPPHLHFQLVNDLGGRRGDYPGVCRFSEREKWKRNSPTPDLVLQLDRFKQ